MRQPFTPRFVACVALFSFALSLPAAAAGENDANAITVAPTDWPWWRGPTRDGVAPAGQTPPLHWSATENVIWKSPLPGRGHGSPIIVGDQVFLATADPQAQTQSVLGFDFQTGKELWRTAVHKGGLEVKGHAKSTLASSSLACDGSKLFVNFLNGGAIHTTALDRTGKILWQVKVADYVIHQGFGSSPAVYQSLVLVSADHKSGGVVVGLDRQTGKVVWTRSRPKLPNYTSPIILPAAGRDQLLLTGCDLVTALDPLTGKELWEAKGSTTECVTSTVTDGKLIFTSGGYPKNHISAIKADGSGALAWESNTRLYVPSLIVRGEHLYTVTDAGFATCWESATGKELWKERLDGSFSSSPVLVGERIYATNEAGKTFVFKAAPTEFTLLGQSQLGQEVMATPAICRSRVFMRVTTKTESGRQEFLYCLGESK